MLKNSYSDAFFFSLVFTHSPMRPEFKAGSPISASITSTGHQTPPGKMHCAKSHKDDFGYRNWKAERILAGRNVPRVLHVRFTMAATRQRRRTALPLKYQPPYLSGRAGHHLPCLQDVRVLPHRANFRGDVTISMVWAITTTVAIAGLNPSFAIVNTDQTYHRR